MNIIILLSIASYISSQIINTPCPYPPCFPSDNLVLGIDLSSGVYKRQVLAASWSNNSFYFNPYNNKYYDILVNFTVTTVGNTIILDGTLLFNTTAELESWQASQSIDNQDYILGMYSHTSMTYQSIDTQYISIRDTGYVLYTVGLYEASINKNNQKLDPECEYSVMQLPEEYNQVSYFEFIDAYGTHYSYNTILGLKYQFLSQYKSCMTYTKNQEYIYEQTMTSGWLSSDEHTSFSGQTTVDTYYSSRSITSELYFGGDVQFQNSDTWNKWIESAELMINPVPVAIKATPIYNLITDPVRQENMIRAYHEYFQAMKEQQDLIIAQKKLGPRKVSYGIYTFFNNVAYFSQYPTYTYLSANETMNPTGLTGSCDSLYKESYVSGHNGDYTNYFYNQRMFQCKRDGGDKVIAMNYFNNNQWTSDVRKKDDCTNIYVNKRYFNTGLVTTYDWIYENNNYYGSSYDSQKYKSYPKSNIVSYNVTYYNFNTQFDAYVYTSYYAYDGPYSYPDSSTSCIAPIAFPCSAFFTCMIDCEYFTIVYDINKVIVPVCTC